MNRRLLRRPAGPGIVGGAAVEVEATDLGYLRLSVVTFEGRRAVVPLEADDVAALLEVLALWLGDDDVFVPGSPCPVCPHSVAQHGSFACTAHLGGGIYCACPRTRGELGAGTGGDTLPERLEESARLAGDPRVGRMLREAAARVRRSR